jgi:sec-independent protein translocase protein TatB
MFEVGFQELVLVFVIGLLILGPERLPRVAAQLGRWVGRARRMANQLRYQLEREIALEEINRAQRPAPKPSGPSQTSEHADAASPGDTATSAPSVADEAGGAEPDVAPAAPLGQAAEGISPSSTAGASPQAGTQDTPGRVDPADGASGAEADERCTAEKSDSI